MLECVLSGYFRSVLPFSYFFSAYCLFLAFIVFILRIVLLGVFALRTAPFYWLPDLRSIKENAIRDGEEAGGGGSESAEGTRGSHKKKRKARIMA